MYNVGLEKAEESKIKLPTSVESQRKQGNSRKASISVLLTTGRLCVDQNKLWKTIKETGIRDTLSAS